MDASEAYCMAKMEVFINSLNDDAVNSFLDLNNDLEDDDSDCLTGDNNSIVADVTLSLATVGLLLFLQLMVWGNYLLYSLSSTRKEQFC